MEILTVVMGPLRAKLTSEIRTVSAEGAWRWRDQRHLAERFLCVQRSKMT